MKKNLLKVLSIMLILGILIKIPVIAEPNIGDPYAATILTDKDGEEDPEPQH